MHAGRGRKIPAIRAAEKERERQKKEAEELAEKAKLARIQAERNTGRKSIEYFIKQKEMEIQALNIAEKYWKTGYLEKGDKKKLTTFERLARRSRRISGRIYLPFKWVLGLMLRGEKRTFSEVRKARFPTVKEIIAKRQAAEADKLSAENFLTAFDRSPENWLKELKEKGINKIIKDPKNRF